MEYTAEFFENTKIRIESPEHSKYVQELAGSCGYETTVPCEFGRFELSTAKYLFFYDDYRIGGGWYGCKFDEHQFKETRTIKFCADQDNLYIRKEVRVVGEYT